MDANEKIIIPKAITKCQNVSFNVCQYLPFMEIMKKNNEKNKWVWNGKNILITDEVGVGKTFETGIILRELYEKGKKIVIFCPKKLCSGWVKKMSCFGLNFVNYDDKKMITRLTVIPYSAFESSDSERIKNIEYDILVLDEAHYIRNTDTGKYKGIKALIEKNESKLKVFLTGTPIFNGGSDNKTLTDLLSINNELPTTKTTQGVANLYDIDMLIRTFGVSVTEKEKEIYKEIYFGDYGYLKGFLKRIAVSSFASLKEWVNSKPEKMKELIEKHNSEIQNEIDQLENRNLSLDEIDNLKSDLKSKMLSSYTVNEQKELKNMTVNWTIDNDSKFKSLLKLLEYMKNNSDEDKFKVVIFSTFISTCEYLKRRLGEKYRVDLVVGQTKNVDEIIGNFREGDTNILVCSEAVREGQDLQVSHYLIHYDLPYTPAAIGQRNGRIYRTGQENNAEIFYMRTSIQDEYECDDFIFTWDMSYDCRLFDEIIYSKYLEIKQEKDIVDIKILPDENWRLNDKDEIVSDNKMQDKRKAEIKDKMIFEIIEKHKKLKSTQDTNDSKMVDENQRKQIAKLLLGDENNQDQFENILKFLSEENLEDVIKDIKKYYGLKDKQDLAQNGTETDQEEKSIPERMEKLIDYLAENSVVDKMAVWNKNKEEHIEVLNEFCENILGESTSFQVKNDNSEGTDIIDKQKNEIVEFEKELVQKMRNGGV